MQVIESAMSRSRTVLLSLVTLLVAGIAAYATIPKEAEPDIEIPLIYVNVTFDGISPEDSERLLVRPMEQEVRSIEGIKEMQARAYEGGANMTIEFDAGIDTRKALQDVREKIDMAKAKLPDEAQEPVVSELRRRGKQARSFKYSAYLALQADAETLGNLREMPGIEALTEDGYHSPSLGDVLPRLELPEGPIAVITAGWQEREGEDEEMDRHLGGRSFDLEIYRRADRVFATDPELREAHREMLQVLLDQDVDWWSGAFLDALAAG